MSDPLASWLERIGTEHPRGVTRGLDRVRIVADRLGVVPPAPTTIIVAGTNGKGSTTAFAEHLLLAAGRSVGTTTSPHMHRFNERIRVAGYDADDESIVLAFEAIESCRGTTTLSYFEYAILAALQVITRSRVEYAVLEVGLGGRLDAVNIVDGDVAVISSIGLDHQEYLGDSRDLIGREKAGVMRRRSPVVCGEAHPPASILDRARQHGSAIFLAGRDFGHESGGIRIRGHDGRRRAFELPTSAVDPVNAATAAQAVCLAGCPLTQCTVTAAARTVRNPGRLEVVDRGGRTWILDVAHNPHGAAFLADRLRARFAGRNIRGIVGCLDDKDVAGMLEPLRALVSEFAYVDSRATRGRSGAATRAAADDADAFAGSLDNAIGHTLSLPGRDADAILAFGSFDLVERVRIRLGLTEL